MRTGGDTLLRVVAAVAAAIGIAVLLGDTSSAAGAPTATTTTPPGVVTVTTKLGYQQGAAAGTGIVLSSNGTVLTNNHVIRGATTVNVVVPSTHRSYRATVVGYSVTSDVAVLELTGASGLATATIGDSSKLRIGQAVTAVGNAGGTGTLRSAAGTITGLHRSIVASDGLGLSERLTGLIETDAALEPGDSGGPLVDSSSDVIGLDTAASSTFVFAAANSQGYAIPIARARSLAQQIVAGRSSAIVHVGPTAFLGVQIRAASRLDRVGAGAVVAAVVPSSAADRAGLQAGDVITRFAGHPIASYTELGRYTLGTKPGARVTIVWTDSGGSSRSATVALAAGPPQ